jgi:hypothetical protein
VARPFRPAGGSENLELGSRILEANAQIEECVPSNFLHRDDLVPDTVHDRHPNIVVLRVCDIAIHRNHELIRNAHIVKAQIVQLEITGAASLTQSPWADLIARERLDPLGRGHHNVSHVR